MKIIGLFFLNFLLIFGAKDIDTDLKGDQSMIDSLRSQINADPVLKKEDISIGAGLKGAIAFKENHSKFQLLLVWQWLDDLVNISENTIVIIPKHAKDNRFKNTKTIEIEGVLHTRILENIQKEVDSKIFEGVELIVMLAGDTQQENGEWKPFTIDDLMSLLKVLPKDKKILFLNGPRTGKFILNVRNELEEDKTAHKTSIDYITNEVLDFIKENKLFSIIDFKYGQPSFWGPALKYCVNSKNILLILPGESTSMISEALGLGLKPSIFTHQAMTVTSKNYVDYLIDSQKSTQFPKMPNETHQTPTPLQESVVVSKLKQIIYTSGY